MKKQGVSVGMKDIDEIMKEVDEDGSGLIEYDEFITAIKKRMNEIDLKEEIREAFRCFDDEDNGLIRTDVLKKILKSKGDILKEDEI